MFDVVICFLTEKATMTFISVNYNVIANICKEVERFNCLTSKNSSCFSTTSLNFKTYDLHRCFSSSRCGLKDVASLAVF